MFIPINAHSAASSAMHTAFANAVRLPGRATPERWLDVAATAAARGCALSFNRGMRWCRRALLNATGV